MRPTGARVLVVDDQPAEHQVAGGDPHARAATTCATASSGEEALEAIDRVRRRPRAPRHRDAGHGRLRGVPADPRAGRHGVPAGRHGDRQRRRGEGQGARGRRRRLPDQADQPERAARPGRVPGPDQALPGHDQAAGRRARRLEPRAGVAGRDPGGPARADGPAPALPVPSAGRADRRLGRRVVPREPPARDRRRLLRPARLHDRSPSRASPRR